MIQFFSFFLFTKFFLSAFQRMEFYLSQELPTGNLSFSFFLFFFPFYLYFLVYYRLFLYI